MRLGITLPNLDADGNLLDAKGIAERASRLEEAGFDGIWRGDHLPFPGHVGRDRPDPLMYLAVAAQATNEIELGTCIFAVPLRTKYDVAQRFFSLETLAPGRVTIGVGTGSQRFDYEAAGVAWEGRFGRLREHMEAVHAVFDGKAHETVEADPGFMGTPSDLETWPQRIGRPRFVLGAWISGPQVRQAVQTYDGWMASAGPGVHFGGGRQVLAEGIRRYRELGGGRAMVSTIVTDLNAATTDDGENGPFNLRCDPDTARERLGWLEELGYDDVIIWPFTYTPPLARTPFPPKFDFTDADLEQWRSLLAKDERRP